jgi:hypothetical protein
MKPQSTETEATMTRTTLNRRELAHRRSAGIDVTLFWSSVGGELTVEVLDETLDEFFVLDVPREQALDAFLHPFAYRAARRARDAYALLGAAA